MSEKKPEPQRISAIPPFGLRMLPDLRQRIEAEAEKNGRSMNSEIVARLESSLQNPIERFAGVAGLSDDLRLIASHLMEAAGMVRERGGSVSVNISLEEPEPGPRTEISLRADEA